MTVAAAGRVLALTLILPFANLGKHNNMVRDASAKWRTVLKCAVGLGDWV